MNKKILAWPKLFLYSMLIKDYDVITADRTIIKYVLSLLILISGLFVVSVPVNAGPVKPVSVSMGASVGSQVIFYDNYNPTSRHTIGGG